MPSISPRLAAHAVCYNDVKYHSLIARVNGQASSLTQGSVILAFCSDPSDVVPGGRDAISWARSQMCNQSGKYWETLNVRVPASQLIGPNNGSFKNNIGQIDNPRSYSPGFFALIAISPPNDECPLEIELEWEVTMSQPTYNPLVDEGVTQITALDFCGLMTGTGQDAPFIDYVAIWDVGTSTYLPAPLTQFSPLPQLDLFYRLPGGPRPITANSSTLGQNHSSTITHIRRGDSAGNNTDKMYVYYLDQAGVFQPTYIDHKPTNGGGCNFSKGDTFDADANSPGFH